MQQLTKELVGCTQGTMSVELYCAKLQKLWEDLVQNITAGDWAKICYLLSISLLGNETDNSGVPLLQHLTWWEELFDSQGKIIASYIPSLFVEFSRVPIWCATWGLVPWKAIHHRFLQQKQGNKGIKALEHLILVRLEMRSLDRKSFTESGGEEVNTVWLNCLLSFQPITRRIQQVVNLVSASSSYNLPVKSMKCSDHFL